MQNVTLTDAEFAYLQRLVKQDTAKMEDYPGWFAAERQQATAVTDKLHWLRRSHQLDVIAS